MDYKLCPNCNEDMPECGSCPKCSHTEEPNTECICQYCAYRTLMDKEMHSRRDYATTRTGELQRAIQQLDEALSQLDDASYDVIRRWGDDSPPDIDMAKTLHERLPAVRKVLVSLLEDMQTQSSVM